MTDRPDVETLRRLEAAATPGPWTDAAIGSEGHAIWPVHGKGRVARLTSFEYERTKADAAFIVAFRKDAAALLTRVEELETTLQTILLIVRGEPGPLLANYHAEVETLARSLLEGSSR